MPDQSARTTRRALASGALGTAGVLVLAGCGGGSSSGSAHPIGGGGKAGSEPRVEHVTITAADGCQVSSSTLQAGAITFKVTNQDATGVGAVELQAGDRIVGEAENIPPGFGSTFTANADAGSYTLYCPGAAKQSVPLTVTGVASAPAGATTTDLLAGGVKDYARYVSSQVGDLVRAAKTLKQAIASGNLARAQSAYDKARPYYEKIEPVAESFTVGTNNLDADIDARINDVPAGRFEGFHRIEQGLFQVKSPAGLSSYAVGLVSNVERLERLTTGLTYRPAELATGAQELLDEVATSKITGEEERYSHIDLLDFESNDAGAEQAFADLQPALKQIDATLTATIAARFATLDALVDTYRTGSNPSGFVYYGALTRADKRKLADAVKAVQEPLSLVASRVAKA